MEMAGLKRKKMKTVNFEFHAGSGFVQPGEVVFP
jgi:hypothetical protein